MTLSNAQGLANQIFESAVPFLQIQGIHAENSRWCRKVADGDHRRGPWLCAKYNVIDQTLWDTTSPCLYLVKANDSGLRYVGISKNKLKDRWRLSPAYDVSLSKKLPEKQLFHSQCWKQMENEFATRQGVSYEVRVIFGHKLKALLLASDDFGELASVAANEHEIVAQVEKWLRSGRMPNQSNVPGLFPWNAN